MIIGITGHSGRLGTELLEHGCIPIRADITIPTAIKAEIDSIDPDVIIHCAAVTDVDACESSKADLARKVNIIGTQILRTMYSKRIIYMSTDYVFDGVNGAYKEHAMPHPINHYGLTKYMGEQVIREYKYPSDVIVRTTILYGGHKPDFVTKVIDKYKTGNYFEVSQVLIGSPTYVKHLADALIELCYREQIPTIINIAGSTVISRYDLAIMIGNVFGYDVNLCIPTKEENGNGARRPRKAGLKIDLAKKIGLPIYSVLDGLQLMKG